MSKFECPVVRVGAIEKHPNAHSLSITKVGEYPVIIRTGDFQSGSLAVYVPIDSVCPPTGATAFLADPARPEKPVRIKAKRLRGVFSMGLLLPIPDGHAVASDMAPILGIKKWEEPEIVGTTGEDERAPDVTSPVFDVENWRAFPHAIRDDEPVVITEKIHGCNARFMWLDGRLWMASRTRWKKPTVATVWSKAAENDELATKLNGADGFIVYGEVYGQVQDLKYGLSTCRFAAFDVWDWRAGRFLDFTDAKAWCDARGISFVPVLSIGPFSREAMEAYGRGETALGGCHIREGCVVRPMRERFSEEIGGRAILKWVSEDYLLRKGGTEAR